ncbi:hypothetical protein Tco_0721937 [Tanacetum coccineum]
MKWRGGSGDCDDHVDGCVGAAVTGGGEGGDNVELVAVTNMVVVAAVEARGGETELSVPYVQAVKEREDKMREAAPA